jgi:hypothetical protein
VLKYFKIKRNLTTPFRLLFFLFIAVQFTVIAQFKVKSLQVYSGDDAASFPIIFNSDGASGNITIEFDVQSNSYPELSLYFRFCDRHWNPVENLFLFNRGNEVVPFLDLVRLPVTITETQYHFKGSFPDNNGYITFPYSGKWMFFVTAINDTSMVYAKGRFVVAENIVDLKIKTETEIRSDKYYSPSDLAKAFIFSINFSLPFEFFPQNVTSAEVIENQKIFYPTVIEKNQKNSLSEFYWDGNRNFTFVAKGITPGNEYRQANLKQYTNFNLKEVYAQRDRIETSRFYKRGGKDLNGGFVLTDFMDVYSDYLNVRFTIRPPEPFNSDIYLSGSFNNWTIDDDYKLTNSDGLFTLTIPLKRGIYDYLYVTRIGNNIDWNFLEGNLFETSHIYRVFIFYKDPSFGGYDRIIGYSTIKMNENNGKN